MKVLNEEKGIDNSEGTVKRQVQKYTSYKRRGHELETLTQEAKKEKTMKAKKKMEENLKARNGKKLFVIKKRKRVYLKSSRAQTTRISESDDETENKSGGSNDESDDDEMTEKKRPKRAQVVSDSDDDPQSEQNRHGILDSSVEPETDEENHNGPAETMQSELMFSELDTASERVMRNRQLNLKNNVPLVNDYNGSSDETSFSAEMTDHNRW